MNEAVAEQLEAFKADLSKELSAMRLSLKQAEEKNAELQEELDVMRDATFDGYWDMPKGHGLADEAKFLRELYQKMALGALTDVDEIMIAVATRFEVLRCKDVYEHSTATYMEAALKRSMANFSNLEDIRAKSLQVEVDMRGQAKKKLKRVHHSIQSQNSQGSQSGRGFRRPSGNNNSQQ
ncbi:hypothetical protein J8273_7626 [Carpediemonas membranifera]|uniref:Uncharacterized protein n=1 Tax=Carpediemonas membranifera TaxID=201153 RepID=A0A8J6B709_9EUKA|nr:hypothetical protein J8273_7626 [Carpediemonas membranifera]|eukprot:KAG9391302.1 hypothetical protein J8273_7626 [Carpediemonas membranifera]